MFIDHVQKIAKFDIQSDLVYPDLVNPDDSQSKHIFLGTEILVLTQKFRFQHNMDLLLVLLKYAVTLTQLLNVKTVQC